jgi:hypothetical protein
VPHLLLRIIYESFAAPNEKSVVYPFNSVLLHCSQDDGTILPICVDSRNYGL